VCVCACVCACACSLIFCFYDSMWVSVRIGDSSQRCPEQCQARDDIWERQTPNLTTHTHVQVQSACTCSQCYWDIKLHKLLIESSVHANHIVQLIAILCRDTHTHTHTHTYTHTHSRYLCTFTSSPTKSVKNSFWTVVGKISQHNCTLLNNHLTITSVVLSERRKTGLCRLTRTLPHLNK